MRSLNIVNSQNSGFVSIYFSDPTLNRQMSSVIMEAERQLEAMIQIKRALDKFIMHMESFLVVTLTTKMLPLIVGEQSSQTRLFQFLMDPQTTVMENAYETESCKNLTLTYLHSPEMLLFVQIVCPICINRK